MSQAPVPQKVRPLNVDGQISFNCCGTQHQQTLNGTAIIRCPHCGMAYTLELLPRPVQFSSYAPGLKVRMKRTVEALHRVIPLTLKKDSIFLTSEDTYAVLNLQEGEVVLEYPSPVTGKQDRILVVIVPEDSIELVEETTHD